MEDDWVTNFFDKCRIVSDDEMQSLWAKVLAGEANSPGAFSKRTVNFLGSLDKADAHLFTSLCGFGWFLDVDWIVPLVYSNKESIYKKLGINFSSLTHLEDIGLVSFGGISGFKRKGFPKRITVYYYSQPVIVEFRNEENNLLNIGNVLLTKTGQQLAQICSPRPVEGFMDYIIDKWVKEGLVLSSPYPRNQ